MHLIKYHSASISDLKQLTGIIYVIVCLKNGKRYVGKTIYSFYDRYTNNWWLIHHNRCLLKDVYRYGYENFKILILHKNESFDHLLILENYYIKLFKSTDSSLGYNLIYGNFQLKPSKMTPLVRKSHLISVDEFILRSNYVHNSKYIYNTTIYNGMTNPVTITCPKHGNFYETPRRHLNGFGCKLCKDDEIGVNNFISKINEKFGFRYDYSKVTSVNGPIKITIICKIHGEFNQLSSAHLRGQGCPSCAREIHSKKGRDLHRSGYYSECFKSSPVIMIDKFSGNILQKFYSLREAVRYLSTIGVTAHVSHISDVCANKRKTHCGYKWAYAI